MQVENEILTIPRFRIKNSKSTKKRLHDTIEKGQLAYGPHVEHIEYQMSQLSKCEYAVSTSNGFSAIFLSIRALGLSGQKIGIPVISTCMSILNAVKASGNIPVFLDSQESSPNISSDQIGWPKSLSAIIAANYFGELSDVRGLKKYGIPVIEDCAQSAGTTYKSIAPSPSDIQIFSFYPTKLINGVDGGMICTNLEDIASKADDLKYYRGVRKNDSIVRYNFKMSNIHAVFATSSLEELDESCARRMSIAQKFSSVKGLQSNSFYKEGVVPQKYLIKTKSEDERNAKIKMLVEMGVPATTELNSMLDEVDLSSYPNALDWLNCSFSIPCYEALTDEEIEYIYNILKRVFN